MYSGLPSVRPLTPIQRDAIYLYLLTVIAGGLA